MTGVRDRYERFPAECIRHDEQRMRCPVTGDVYAVTRWVETSRGGRVALEKPLVNEVQV